MVVKMKITSDAKSLVIEDIHGNEFILINGEKDLEIRVYSNDWEYGGTYVFEIQNSELPTCIEFIEAFLRKVKQCRK